MTKGSKETVYEVGGRTEWVREWMWWHWNRKGTVGTMGKGLSKPWRVVWARYWVWVLLNPNPSLPPVKVHNVTTKMSPLTHGCLVWPVAKCRGLKTRGALWGWAVCWCNCTKMGVGAEGPGSQKDEVFISFLSRVRMKGVKRIIIWSRWIFSIPLQGTRPFPESIVHPQHTCAYAHACTLFYNLFQGRREVS